MIGRSEVKQSKEFIAGLNLFIFGDFRSQIYGMDVISQA
jgi:hypothetical protein